MYQVSNARNASTRDYKSQKYYYSQPKVFGGPVNGFYITQLLPCKGIHFWSLATMPLLIFLAIVGV